MWINRLIEMGILRDTPDSQRGSDDGKSTPPPKQQSRRDDDGDDGLDEYDDYVLERSTPREKVRAPTAYERQLRQENKRRREEATAARREADDLKAAKAEADRKLADLQKQFDEFKTTSEKSVKDAAVEARTRIMLEAAAKEAGLLDLDQLALTKLSDAGIKLSEDGKLVGATEHLAKLKEQKPFLFKVEEQKSTTSNAEPPKKADDTKTVKDLDPKAYAAARAAALAA